MTASDEPAHEPRPRAGQLVAEHRLGPDRLDRGPGGDRRHRARQQQEQLQLRLPVPVARAQQPGHEPGVERQQHVERGLDGQAPGHADARDDRLLAPALQQPPVDPPLVAEDPRRVGGVEQAEREHGHPVRGQDAQGPAPRVAPHLHRRAPVQPGAHERPVEQERGQHEEDRDAAVQADRPRAERVLLVEAAELRRVGHDDEQRRDRAQRVQQREPWIAGGRGDGVGGHGAAELIALRRGALRLPAAR